MRPAALVIGVVVLATVWVGPLPWRAAGSFTGHMLMHVGVVAVAAPLIAFGSAGSRYDPSAHYPVLFAALPATLLEFVVIWGWHAPALHVFARRSTLGLVLEQASFLAVGLLVWLSCLGFSNAARPQRSAVGVIALLLTSMHMTLLGALLALAPRPLYRHGHMPPGEEWNALILADQQRGGIVMLAVGGIVYLLGGLLLAARLLAAADGNPPPRVGQR